MTPSNQLALIACHAAGKVIGNKNSIPWDYPEDRVHFKRITMGHTLIVGRKTYDEIPWFRLWPKSFAATNHFRPRRNYNEK